jgi:DNA repair protein RecO
MRELYSKAIVLDRKDYKDFDAIVSLFTQDYGKVVAFAKSVRKPTSKLSAHLQPMTFIKVRFIQRQGPSDGWAIIDCLRDDEFLEKKTFARFDLIPIVKFIDVSLFEFQTDRKLWAYLKHIFLNFYPYSEVAKGLLKIMGFNPSQGSCFFCGSKKISAFHIYDQVFLCSLCASKFLADKILLIGSD